jgi:hypothetical protein
MDTASAPGPPAGEVNPQKLISLEITGGGKVWNRILYTDETPVKEDLEFYYRNLIGIADATVAISIDEVPAEFNTGLLGINEGIPTTWPANDLETTVGSTENREKFHAFVRQLCEMERARVVFQTFRRSAKLDLPPADMEPMTPFSDEPAVGRYTRGYVPIHRTKQREWVKEVLASLNEGAHGNDAIVIAACEEEVVPYAWVFTPVIAGLRRTIGSRIVLNHEIGKKWQYLLGSTFYPDMVISRRITTAAWTFQHETSTTLVKSLTDWYLASQAAVMTDGVSNLLPDADRDIGNVLMSIRKIKINEGLLFENEGTSDRVGQIFKLMSALEHTSLESADTNKEVSPLSAEVFHKYLNYLFRGSNIPRDLYTSLDGVTQIVARWESNRMGFRKDTEPLLASWKELWELTMRGAPSAARVNLFLATLDTYDPLQLGLYNHVDRMAITHEWVRIFLDTQIVKDTKCRIRSVTMYDKIQEWCAKYLPMEAFASAFSPMFVGPVLTRRGLVTIKCRGGRVVRGIRFRDPAMAEADVGAAGATAGGEGDEGEEDDGSEEAECPVAAAEVVMGPAEEEDAAAAAAAAAAPAKNTVTFQPSVAPPKRRAAPRAKVEKTKTAAAASTTVKKEDGSRIETFFAVTTETIHLGTL